MNTAMNTQHPKSNIDTSTNAMESSPQENKARCAKKTLNPDYVNDNDEEQYQNYNYCMKKLAKIKSL
jgi:hypothetical protein